MISYSLSFFTFIIVVIIVVTIIVISMQRSGNHIPPLHLTPPPLQLKVRCVDLGFQILNSGAILILKVQRAVSEFWDVLVQFGIFRCALAPTPVSQSVGWSVIGPF